MSAAIEAVLQQRMSQRTACKTFGIPRCTLQMRLAGRTEQGTKPGRPTMLTHEQRISWSNMHATEQVWASALVDTSFWSGDYRLADGGGVSESGIRKTGAFLVAFCTKSSRYSIINFRTIGVDMYSITVYIVHFTKHRSENVRVCVSNDEISVVVIKNFGNMMTFWEPKIVCDQSWVTQIQDGGCSFQTKRTQIWPWLVIMWMLSDIIITISFSLHSQSPFTSVTWTFCFREMLPAH